MKKIKKTASIFSALTLSMFLLTGCVDQSGGAATGSQTSNSESDSPKIIATSMAVVDICDKLGIDLIGIPASSLSEAPERYTGLPTIGTAMSPDMEIVTSMQPDWILSPVSLVSDLQPKYEAIGAEYAFLNLNSVAGMYKSIQQLGSIFGKEDAAQALVDEFVAYYEAFQRKRSTNCAYPYGASWILCSCDREFLRRKSCCNGRRKERICW